MPRTMFRVLGFVLVLSLLEGGLLLSGGIAQERPLYLPGEVLVKFKADVSPGRIQAVKADLGLEKVRRFKRIDVEHLRIASGGALDVVLTRLRADGVVEYAEPNYLRYPDAIPNDPSFPQLWGLDNTGQTGGTTDADIDAPEAWNMTTGDPNFVVAVIDSGMDMTHPDLAANVWTNPGEIPGNGIDDDANGYVDDVHGWDFSGNDNNPSDTVSVCGGHGTHVSGTIGGAGNNGIGVAGVNWTVMIMPLKVFKPYLGIFCSASDADIIGAIHYAADFGVRVSNNSYGGGPPSQAFSDAIRASGSLYIAAAGNDGLNNDTIPSYPASYKLPNIVAVAATDENDLRASFSNYGIASVDLAAPGVGILSAFPGNSYSVYDGTSMATPHVVGSAALLWAQEPAATVNEIKWRLLRGVDPKGLPILTGGRLNVNTSLNLPPPLVTVNLTPVGSTTIPRGGTITYTFQAVNQSGAGQTVKLSAVVRFPNGVELNLNRTVTLTMTPGQVITQTYSRPILPGVPVGNYTLFGRAEVVSQSYDEDPVAYTIF